MVKLFVSFLGTERPERLSVEERLEIRDTIVAKIRLGKTGTFAYAQSMNIDMKEIL